MKKSRPEPFVNQVEARAYVEAIEDPIQQLLMRVLHGQSIAFLMSDPVFRDAHAAFDLLTFLRAAHRVLSQTDMVKAILSGSITSFEDPRLPW